MERYQLYRNAVDAWIEAHREDYIRDLSTLIRIPSVAVTDSDSAFAFGDECAKALDAALRLAENFGLVTENDEYYCGSALLRGEIDREFAMVGHLDVVPAGSGWDFPPFEPTLRDGQLIGRGAVDNKGAVMAAMYALRCLRELNIPLRRTIRLVMGCQEEAGMNDIPHFLEKHKNALPQLFLVCDCAFPIHFGEKGIVRTMLETELKSGNLLSLRGGTAPNSIPEQAEAVLRGISCEQAAQRLEGFDVRIEPHPQGVRISARGIAGHAASPEQGTENAIAKLVCALKDSGLLEPEAQNAVSFLDAVLGDYYGSGVGIAYGDELSGKNTLVGGLIRLENGRLRQSLNIRCAITADMDGMIAALDEACRAHGFTLTVLEKNPPLYIPLDSMHGLPLRLTGLANELLGLGQLKPAVLPGGTHTRLLPNAIGYGPNMGPDLEFKKKRFGAPHGANEAVIIQDMMDAIRVYVLTWLWLDDQPESALPDGPNT